MASTHTSDADAIQPHLDDAPSRVELIIHHQCPDIELISPVHASFGATCYISPDQRVDTGSTMQTSFNIDPDQEESIGVLIYKLQRKNANQFDEEETTCIQLVMIWNVNNSREFRVISDLIEHDKGYVWDRFGLMELSECYALSNMQYGPIEQTWLMHDNTGLMTNMNATRGACCKLEVMISEASINKDTQRPWYFDVNR
jgi:hypothetical protein